MSVLRLTIPACCGGARLIRRIRLRTAGVLDDEDAGWIRGTFKDGCGRILDRLNHKAKGDRNDE
jgi:hypothetical protein